jgi:homoserine O-acetyltransferase/O-succinyltransferase
MTTLKTITPVVQPTFEGDLILDEHFALEEGGSLTQPTLRYTIYGELNEARDNVILVCHALSGSSRVGEWWPLMFGPTGLFDLDRYCIVCANIFGSCYGSTGPCSINPATGKLYGPTFPLISIRDIVRAEALLLDFLGIDKVQVTLGPSIGGMQVLEWAINYPDRVGKAIAMGAAPLNAMGLALNHMQRQSIQLDSSWCGGNYSLDNPPRSGLSLARQIAMISYKTQELFDTRFGRKPNRNGEDPYCSGENCLVGGRFDIGGYLDYQGELFHKRFDANSYLSILRTMDTFDPTRGYNSPKEAYSRIRAELLLIGLSTDWLIPAGDVMSLAEEIIASGAPCEYREMISHHGHDGFLAEMDTLVSVIGPVLD